jgi:hypothetical protein
MRFGARASRPAGSSAGSDALGERGSTASGPLGHAGSGVEIARAGPLTSCYSRDRASDLLRAVRAVAGERALLVYLVTSDHSSASAAPR